MTADRTQHVLDAIDGALEDWTVSGDAMRWSPEPVEPGVWRVDYSHQPEHMRCEIRPVFTDVRLAPLGTPMPDEPLFPARWISAAVELYGSAIRAWRWTAAEQMHRMLNPTPEALDMRAQILRAFDLTSAEAGFEPDPRARALALRRTRNTGPERKPAGQQKRPREL